MLDYLLLLVAFARAVVSSRAELVAENLLLRHQLAVLTRPTRTRPRTRPRLPRGDRVIWVLARRHWRRWRRWRRWSHHLVVGRPPTGDGDPLASA